MTPTEHQEGVALAKWMRARGIVFVHVPNEGARGRVHGKRLRDAGVSAGCPDYLIFSVPPARPDVRGVAIELKRRRPAHVTVTKAQRAWCADLDACGWVVEVCRGAPDAVEILRGLGWE